MSWDFLGKLTRPIGDFEEKIFDNTPGGTPIWRLRQKLGEGFHDESGLSNSQAVGIGALLGTGAAGAGGAFAGGGASELGTAGAWGGGGAGGGAGAGAGGYTVANYAPSAEASSGGAMDMYGSQASPAGGSIFNYSSPASASNYRMPQQQQQHKPVQQFDTMYDDGTSRQNDNIQALIRALRNA